MDRQHQFNRFIAARILTTAVVAAGGWLLLDTLSAPVAASASTPASQASTGDDSLLGGLLDTASPVVDSVDRHLATVTDLVPTPAPATVAEILDTVDSGVTHTVAAVPVVDNAVTPVVTGVVEPLAQPILEPVVNQVVAPVLDAVVTPVVAVATPVVDVVTPIVAVVAPAVDLVIPPISTADAAAVSPLDPVLPPFALPTATEARTMLQTPAGWAAVVSVGAADTPLLTGSHQPAAPVLPAGEPFTSTALPGSSGSSAGGAGSGSGPNATTVLPAGFLPAPEMRFHSSLPSGDELPPAPSFDPGSTPG